MITAIRISRMVITNSSRYSSTYNRIFFTFYRTSEKLDAENSLYTGKTLPPPLNAKKPSNVYTVFLSILIVGGNPASLQDLPEGCLSVLRKKGPLWAGPRQSGFPPH
jgi:hypothetical protein